MKLQYCGTPLQQGLVFNDADSGEPDMGNRQAREPVRLLGAPPPLSDAEIAALRTEFFDTEFPGQRRKDMLLSVGVPADEVLDLTKDPTMNWQTSWRILLEALASRRAKQWADEDKERPKLGLWGYQNRMIRVDGWEPHDREEVKLARLYSVSVFQMMSSPWCGAGMAANVSHAVVRNVSSSTT